MVFTIIIAFIALMSLIVLHEFGHFILAKKFGVAVDEFGIGYPPRIFGKKIGDTIYSLNLIPLGAFVRVRGEEGGIEDIKSFAKKPIYQRMLIVLGGVVMFWIISWILISIALSLGVPAAVSDEAQGLIDPRVRVIMIAPNSPAEQAGLMPGDAVIKINAGDSRTEIDKVVELQELVRENLGKEIFLTIERGEKIFETGLTPRKEPPENEGAMGVGLIRTSTKSYPWYEAPIHGAISVVDLTIGAVRGWGMVISNLINGQGMPAGAQVMGPVGIFGLLAKMSSLGASYFIQLIATISIFLALFNILPIPALDGGKLVFLGIEAIRKKPVSQKVEQNLTVFFFYLLILLLIFVTFKDIQRLF
ncbi:RIP metalloprotease RseP [Candidatus Parcubacteria bacterium]|nr:RIP metalloprotease RseP [Candidatus Parcubacteria bacterium]